MKTPVNHPDERGAGKTVRLHPDSRKEVISRNHKTPVGLAHTGDGSIFVSCYGGSVDRIAPNGKAVSVYTGLNTPGVGIIADGPDSVLVADYGGTTVARVDVHGFAGNRKLEYENARLKQMYADLSLENRALKDVIEKNFETGRKA